MSDKMLHGVLSLPPLLWCENETDRVQRYDYYKRASVKILELEAEANRVCEYAWINNRYKTTCKARTGSLYIDSLEEHNMKFCPYCGGKIVTKQQRPSR